MNDYQRIIQRDLLNGESSPCSETERALYDAAGAPDALFILGVEYATRLDREGVERTNVELMKLRKEMGGGGGGGEEGEEEEA